MTAGMPGYARPSARRFLEGRGRYVADLHMPGMLHAVVVRSAQAHADITVDAAAARAAAGVRLVLDGGDILAAIQPPPVIWDVPGQRRSGLRALAHGRVRYVGEPIAIVVAESEAIARDAAALVRITYAPRPLVTSIEVALATDAPLLYDEWPDNIVASAEWSGGEPDLAFVGAPVCISGRYVSGRVSAHSLETRGVLAAYDPAQDGITLHSSTQAPHQVREAIAWCLDIAEHRIRVIAPDVGGAFGSKSCPYGEEILLAHLALRLRATVRWIESRSESFVACVPGRDEVVDIDLALSEDGRILGLKALITLDKGAEPYAASVGAAWAGAMMVTGAYRIANVHVATRVVVTNKTPTGAYRGYGTPEVNFALERALDDAARRIGIDPAELRRRNLVPPDAMPAASATGLLLLDSGRYEEMLDLALDAFDYGARRDRARAARAQGRAVGVGLAFYVEPTNLGPSALCGMIGINSGGFDIATLRMEPSGQVVVFTGQTPMGQGVERVLQQVCAAELTMPEEDVTVVHGDTRACPYTAYGSGGSRGTGIGGSAVMLAAGRLREKICAIGAHLLGSTPDEVELSQGGVQVTGDAARRVSIARVARVAYLAHDLPDGMEPGLDARASFDPAALAITYGVALAEVEVDRETGLVDVRDIGFGHDCGRQINPALVEAQVIGGIVQGIGAALYEGLDHDAAGQPVTRCMRDYPLPFAADVPPIALVHLETPSPFFPNGAKGVGESGTIPIPAAIANAIRDALGEVAGDAVNRLPIRPETLIHS
nr:xanthine dehydrogenase family protein molybdopterin-binding subunit [Sphingomonas sp. Y57]